MSEMVEATLNGKFKIKIPKHRADRPDWYTEQGWEKARLQSMYENTTKKDVMYYIGAEEGEMPALCQMWGADVVLFEPNPAVWGNFVAIWKANNLKKPLGFFGGFASNATRYNELVKWEQIQDYEVIGAHGFKELYLEADNYPQTRLDDYFKTTGIKPPTQLSIDVEGSEFEVLKGAEMLIDEYHPKIWLSLHPEFLFHQWNMYGREVRNWLLDKGYIETLLDYQHEVHLFYTMK